MKLYYDFSGILLIVTSISAVLWLGDIVFLKKRRKVGEKASALIEMVKFIFPVFLIVFLLRAYLYEPFRIPSGSMKPTLLENDFILVNKYTYGLRLPLTGTKLLKINEPKRGDVMVFRYPKDTSVNFIKRVIGLPGDKLRYENKVLYLNGQAMKQHFIEDSVDIDLNGRMQDLKEFSENLDSMQHKIWLNTQMGHDITIENEITVPAGHYFMMGDNRDYSEDSRFWGFVPEELILGKASAIWMSWDALKKDIRWDRMGSKL